MSSKFKFLMVEDDPQDVLALSRALEASGVAEFSHAASSLEQAKDKARQAHYDAVILDLGLPDSSGVDGVIELQASLPELPIVVCSGRADEAAALRSMRLGAEDFISKDALEPGLLGRTLRYAIGRHRRKREAFRDMDALRHSLGLAELQVGTDPYCGLPNIQGLRQFLEQMARNRPGLSVVAGLATLNPLKSGWDRAAREFATRLQQGLGSADFAARTAENEFAVVLPGLDRRDALERGRRLLPPSGPGRSQLFRASLALTEVRPPFLDLEQLRMQTRAMRRGGGAQAQGHVICSWSDQPLAAASKAEVRPARPKAVQHRVRLLELFSSKEDPAWHLSYGLDEDSQSMVDSAFCRPRLQARPEAQALERMRHAKAWKSDRLLGGGIHLDFDASVAGPDFCSGLLRIVPAESERRGCALFFHPGFDRAASRPLALAVGKLRRAGFSIGMRGVGGGSTSLEALRLIEPDWIRMDLSRTAQLSRFQQKADSLGQWAKMLKPLGAKLLAEDVEDGQDAVLLSSLGFHGCYVGF